MKAVSHEEVSAFKTKVELRNIREWLSRLRGEVDTGMERLEVVLNHLNTPGSGQGSREAGWIPKPTKRFKPKKKAWAHKKASKFRLGTGSGSGPKGDVVSLALERPMVIKKPPHVARLAIKKPKAFGKQTEVGAETSTHPGQRVEIGSLDGQKAAEGAMASSSKLVPDNQVRAHEVSCSKAIDRTRSVPKGSQGVTRGISGGLGLSVGCLGMSREEGSVSSSYEFETATVMMGKEISMISSGLGRTGEVELGLRIEPKTLQVYQRKDVKPKKKQVTSSGEGSGMIHVGLREDLSLGQIQEEISPEITLLESPAASRSGFVGAGVCWRLG